MVIHNEEGTEIITPQAKRLREGSNEKREAGEEKCPGGRGRLKVLELN